MPQIAYAVTGNLQKTLRNRQGHYLAALRSVTIQHSERAKDRLRTDVIAAGLPRRLAFTFQDDVFPERGLAYSPSAIVYTKAPRILASFADGATIRPTSADALLIPIDNSPADDLIRRKGESLMDAFERKFGRNSLFRVNRPGKAPILVARLRASDAGNFRGLGRDRSKTRDQLSRSNGYVEVPVFTLARQVRIRKRLNSRAIAARAQREYPVALAKGVRAALDKSNRETVQR